MSVIASEIKRLSQHPVVIAAGNGKFAAEEGESTMVSSDLRQRISERLKGVGPRVGERVRGTLKSTGQAVAAGAGAAKQRAGQALKATGKAVGSGAVGAAGAAGSAVGEFGRRVLKTLWPLGLVASLGWGFGSALRTRDTSREKEQAVLRRLHQI